MVRCGGAHFLFALFTVCLGACHSAPSPQILHSQIAHDIWRGDVISGTADADRALRLYDGKDPIWTWRFRVLKARILVSRSAWRDALSLLNTDLPPSLATSDIAVSKDMVEGMAYRVGQNYEKSAEKLSFAENLATRSQKQLLCEVLNARGALETNNGLYPAAQATHAQALALARQFGRRDEEASALVSLAWIAGLQENFDAAVERGQTALQVSRSLDRQGLAATAQGNLASSYFELGDFDKALDFYKQGAATSEQLGLTGHAIYWLTGVANSYAALHDYASAEALSQHTLQLARNLNWTEAVTECLNDLASFALETNQVDAGERHVKEALQLEEQGLDHFGVIQSSLLAGRIAAKQQKFSEAEKYYRQVSQDPKAETALRWESQARLAQLHDEQGLTGLAEREFEKSIATIEAARKSIEREDLRLTYLAGGIEFYDAYIDFLLAHGKPDKALRVAELGRARTLNDGMATTSQTGSPAAQILAPRQIARKMQTTMLFYWVGQKRSHLWAITPAEITHFDLPNAATLEPLAKSYRSEVLHTRDPQDAEAVAGRQLYAILVAPAAKLIPQGLPVTVLPDPSLSALNFESLIAPDPQPHFWIDDVTLTTASSLTLLAASTTRPVSGRKSLMIVGDTISPGDEFPALPNAAQEMKSVEQYFPPAQRQILERSAATPTAYLGGHPERFSYIHFVTHGIASVTRPLESAVILSKEGDSYKLYAREIVKHPLTARLVTISACEGAGKKAYSGEGLIGLSWAFLRAGAHNVVGALWEVSDSSTPQFMDVFYSELAKGRSPASALRTAKLSLLHSQDTQSVFKKPYYWAPFQLYAGS